MRGILTKFALTWQTNGGSPTLSASDCSDFDEKTQKTEKMCSDEQKFQGTNVLTSFGTANGIGPDDYAVKQSSNTVNFGLTLFCGRWIRNRELISNTTASRDISLLTAPDACYTMTGKSLLNCTMRNTLIYFILGMLLGGTAWTDEEIKHRFLALDESRFQILYVDQFDPTKNWTIKVAPSRDMQFVDGKIVIGLFAGGFAEYDFATQKLLREVTDPKYQAGSVSACRLKDGRTLIASDQFPTRITLLDANGKEISNVQFPQTGTVRCVRMTPRGTLLFGSNEKHVIEGTLDGKVIRDIEIPDAKHVYMVDELPNGHLLAVGGYSAFFVELDRQEKIVRKVGGLPGPEGIGIYFFASVQVLKNGNIVVANWTGHGANDSEKGNQILEYDSAGKIVWRWHDPNNAGSIHNAIVLE